MKYLILSHTLTATEQRFTVLLCDAKGAPLADAEGAPVWCRFAFGCDCEAASCAQEMKAQLDLKYGPAPSPKLAVDLTGTEL